MDGPTLGLVLIALIAAVAPNLTIVLTHRAQMRLAQAQHRAQQEAATAAKVAAEEAKQESAAIRGAVADVHTLTNDWSTKQEAEIQRLNATVGALRDAYQKTLPKGAVTSDVVPDPNERRSDERREPLHGLPAEEPEP